MTTDTPQFTHDCTRCIFLGRYRFNGPLSDGNFEDVKADLYVCPEGCLGHSIIARYSDEGPEYSSMPASLIARDLEILRTKGGTHTPGLIECFERCGKHPDFMLDIQKLVNFHEAERKKEREVYEAYRRAR